MKLIRKHQTWPYSSLLMALLLIVSGSAMAGQIRTDSLFHHLAKRTFDYYVPSNVRANAPLVLDLHGHGGNRTTNRNYNGGELMRIADREGFIIVWPEGNTWPLNAWNGGPCCFPASELNVDDNGFLRKVISRMQSRMSIDSRRIYVTGQSNGAHMAHRLGLQSADLIAAIAPISFQLSDNWSWRIPFWWYPKNGVPQIEFHTRDDNIVPYNGGLVGGLLGGYFGQPFFWAATAEQGFYKWGAINQCAGSPRKEWHPVSKGTYTLVYDRCKDGTSVRFMTVSAGGHAIVNGPNATNGLNVQQEVWNFVSRYTNKHQASSGSFWFW